MLAVWLYVTENGKREFHVARGVARKECMAVPWAEPPFLAKVKGGKYEKLFRFPLQSFGRFFFFQARDDLNSGVIVLEQGSQRVRECYARLKKLFGENTLKDYRRRYGLAGKGVGC